MVEIMKIRQRYFNRFLLFLVVFVLLFFSGCDKLAEHGFNTIGVDGKIEHDSAGCLLGLSIKNISVTFIKENKENIENTKLKGKFFLFDGSVKEIQYYIGNLSYGETWERRFKNKICNVEAYELFIKSKQGSVKIIRP